MLECLNTYN